MASAVTHRSTPPGDAPQPDQLLNALAWLELHRNQVLIGFCVLIAAVGAGYIWRHQTAVREAKGNAALLAVRARADQPESAPHASDYLKVAEAHASTTAAPRARLLAASTFFSDEKYSEALIEFERALADLKSGPLAAQAAFGIAATLDAQGKLDAAVAKYQEVAAAYPEDAVAVQARLALADIQAARKQPEAALRIYDDLLRDRHAGPLAQQAMARREELVRRHPELTQTGTSSSASSTPPAPEPIPAPAPVPPEPADTNAAIVVQPDDAAAAPGIDAPVVEAPETNAVEVETEPAPKE